MLVTRTKKTAIIIECDELTIEFLLQLIEDLACPTVYMDLCVPENGISRLLFSRRKARAAHKSEQDDLGGK